jgi:hypothetical protein
MVAVVFGKSNKIGTAMATVKSNIKIMGKIRQKTNDRFGHSC